MIDPNQRPTATTVGERLDRQRLRADARQSISSILDAAIACFGENAEASMSSVAKSAGVGRTTLYAHFPTRDSLLEATATHAMEEGNAVLDRLELDDMPPVEAVTRLIESSWEIISRHGGLMSAVERSLGAAALRDHHRAPFERVTALIARGQRAGVFREDLPTEWLVAVFYSLMHTTVAEVDSGRLDVSLAPDAASATYLAVLCSSAK